MKTENIEDIYELSPVQKGILFHGLYAPELGLYLVQFSYTVRGHLDVIAFEQAWQQVVTRHPILRTSFYWEEIDKPLQVVHRHVRVPLAQHDWQEIGPTEQEERLETFLTEDRDRGFNFSQAPLMRVTLIRLADDVYQIIWSKHHLILDGWSGPLVFKEVIQLYEAFCQGQEVSLASCRPFKDYIAWLREQDLAKAEEFWRRLLSGIKVPTPLSNLAVEHSSNQPERYDEEQIKLSAAITARLQSLARQHQLTLNTLFQGAWAFLLSRYSCQTSVVYGCGVSGRPVELVGVESMVGVFINTLPVRVEVDLDQFLLPWLKQIQAQQVEMRQYEYSPLVEVQGWSEVPRGVPLFESIVVFENYPALGNVQQGEQKLEIEKSTGFYKTNYPLNVIGYPGSELAIGINYEGRRFDAATIAGILRHFEIVLEDIAKNPEMRLKDLSLLTPEQKRFALLLEKEVTFDFAECH